MEVVNTYISPLGCPYLYVKLDDFLSHIEVLYCGQACSRHSDMAIS